MATSWIADLPTYPYQQIITIFATAVGCGMLIGIERERHNTARGKPSFAGFRTYVLMSLMGAMSFLFGVATGIVGLMFASGVALVSQSKNTHESPGITSEVALVMSFLIGALCVWQPLVATSSAVIVTGFLLSKSSLDNFASRWLTEAEMRDGTMLLALALVALPLMPNKPYWGTVLNPYVTVRLLILILAVQAVAHLAKRLLSLRHAMSLSSLASGFVSSTATVASLGLQVRTGMASPKVNAGGALISCVATLIQFIIIASGTNMAWLKVVILPVIVGSIVGAVWGLWLLKSPKNINHPPTPTASPNVTELTADNAQTATTPMVNDKNNRMFSLKEAGLVAVALTLIQVMIYGLGQLLGDTGLMAGTLLASIFEIHAAMAAVFVQGSPLLSFSNALMISFLLGMTVHSIAKSVNAVLTGGWQYARYFMAGLWVQTLVFNGILVALMVWG
ncbi:MULTISPECIES: MgtC/SapB family protein [unclassified Moraxella]|uniref:MgtC/SapB family protein n=1 Tax=unclassified Moraxella TaxID=2685852 RepID=UPI003AF9932F